jgi:Heterokaryon incompatibility protein (HET)
MEVNEQGIDSRGVNLNLIQHWRNGCKASHGMVCNVRRSYHLLRELKTINLVDVQSMSLVTKTTTTTETTFVALSYVWGNTPVFKTKTSNIHLLRVPGSLSGSATAITIPRIIRNAIHLTRELGERYLWVDCLCIVQDSDTIEHSLKAMAAIYASAELTIVDAAGEDANHGLRGVRGSADASTIDTPTENRTSHSRDGYPWASKWATRGWTFQESLFSQRLLIFDGLISWVCSRRIWLEERDTILTGEGNKWPLEPDHLGVPVGMMGMLPVIPSLGRWGNFVETFSMRSLTYERDSTKAFAGATEIMSSTFPGGIFNGLPELFFDIAILWQPYQTISRRECDINATGDALASWSWNGWKGAIDCLESWNPFKSGLYRDTGHYSDWVHIVDLSPTVKWYKISRDLQNVPVRNDFFKFQAFRNRPSDTLPPGWTRHPHPDGVYFTNQKVRPGFRYSYPLPVSDHQETNNNDGFGRVIRCVAPRALASFGEVMRYSPSIAIVELVSGTGKPVGCIRLHSMNGLETLKGVSCELIAISKGMVIDHNLMDQELYSERPAEWAIREWEMNSGGVVTDDAFYNVIWLECNGDTGYRKGLGKIGRTAWNCLQPALVGFKLG